MTRYFMDIESGNVYTEEEVIENNAAYGVETDWSQLCEVWPLVENPDDSDYLDWTDDWEKEMTGREED